jgi:hypothetical protein
MKRIVYLFIFVACILGASTVVLFTKDFDGYDIVTKTFKGIINGTYKFGNSAAHLYTYALFFFLLLNAGLIIALLALSLLCGFDYSRIKRFYRLSCYFFLSSLVLTAGWFYLKVIKVDGGALNDIETYKSLLWLPVIPLGLAVVDVVLGLLFAISSRR